MYLLTLFSNFLLFQKQLCALTGHSNFVEISFVFVVCVVLWVSPVDGGGLRSCHLLGGGQVVVACS